MYLASTCERPVLPLSLLEHDHQVLRVEALAGQSLRKMRQELLLHLDAPADRPENLNEYEVGCSWCSGVWVVGIEAEFCWIKFQYSLKLVCRRYTDIHKGVVNRVEHHGLEFIGLRTLQRDCD